MHDLVIRGGTVVDGTGAPARTADVAVTDGDRHRGRAGRRHRPRREIDADGAARHARASSTSTPTTTARSPGTRWLTPSCWHGVTTVVMGNCGVGFAPVRPDRPRLAHRADGGRRGHPRRRAARGHPRGSGRRFPEYLDAARAIARRRRRRRAGAPRRRARLRDGRARRRATSRPPPRTSRPMAAIVRGGHRAPAPSASPPAARSPHRAIDGEPVPGTFAAEDELFGIGRALGELGTRRVRAGAGRRRWARTSLHRRRRSGWMRRLAAAIGRPVTFALIQNNADPHQWRNPARPGRGRPGRRCAGATPRCTAAPCRSCSASRRSTRSRSRRPGARPASACCRGTSRWPASTPIPTSAARIVADAHGPRRRPDRPGLHGAGTASTSSATRPSTSPTAERSVVGIAAGRGRRRVGDLPRPAASTTTAASC